MNKRVAIVGGGIAGLATAYYLHKQSPETEFLLIEQDNRLGGKIVSAHDKGFVVEGGPDSFITQKLSAIELCRELGLGDELIGTNDAARKVFVWNRTRLEAMPDGVMLMIPSKITPFLRSPLISWPGKLRMGLDAVIPPRRDGADESLAEFVRRRLGREALDKIAEPMIAGIYVADAEYLSLQSTFPRFIEMENKYGSLLRGMLAQRREAAHKRHSNGHNGNGNSKAPLSMFMTLRGGLQQLTDALGARIPSASVQLNRRVTALRREAAGYTLMFDNGASFTADAVVLATPAYATAELVRALDPALADELEQVRYVSTATVSLGYTRASIEHPLAGFGFVVPRSAHRRLIASSWSSTKFNHRAPGGHVLLRAFVGGAHAEHLAEQDEAALVEMVREELQLMMGITAEPVLTRVYRWLKANPQYAVGHQARVERIEQRAAQQPGLYLAGSAYHGVGLPDCILDGARVVRSILTRR